MEVQGSRFEHKRLGTWGMAQERWRQQQAQKVLEERDREGLIDDTDNRHGYNMT